ncbi:hypothetical protein L7F22_000393 [Adiantum nelumboides]|nr:hypothetical protein [Adiantum nelumboides]
MRAHRGRLALLVEHARGQEGAGGPGLACLAQPERSGHNKQSVLAGWHEKGGASGTAVPIGTSGGHSGAARGHAGAAPPKRGNNKRKGASNCP